MTVTDSNVTHFLELSHKNISYKSVKTLRFIEKCTLAMMGAYIKKKRN